MGLSLALRSTFAVVTGAACTVALLYVMQALIEHGEEVVQQVKSVAIVDMVRVKEERQLQLKERKVVKPPKPDELPPAPKANFDIVQASTAFQMTNVVFKQDLELGKARYGTADSEYLPIVKVAPAYPQRAAMKNLVGWVLVEFTVTSQGTVRNPVIVDHCAIISMQDGEVPCTDSPNKVFDKAAMEAALKFKYVPKTIDGVAIDTEGVQNLFTFQFDT